MNTVLKWRLALPVAALFGGILTGCSSGDPAPVVGDNEAAKQVVGDPSTNPAFAERAKQKEATMGQPVAPVQNNNSLRGR